MDALKQVFNKIQSQAAVEKVEVELLVQGGEGLSLGFQKEKLDKYSANQSQMAGFRVIQDGHQGYAFTENFSEASLQRAYQQALANAQFLVSGDKFQVSLLSPQKNKNIFPQVYFEELIPMDQKMEVAKSLEKKALQADPRISVVPYSGYSERKVWRRILNSKGMDQFFQQSYYSAYTYPLAKQNDSNKMDGESVTVRHFSQIFDFDFIKKAVDKSTSRLEAQKLSSGEYPILFDQDISSVILSMLSSYFSAKEVDKKTSLLFGKLNQKIASNIFSLVDDPFVAESIASRPFDSEGALSQNTVLIENGVLRNYLTNFEYSQKMNLPHTAHAYRGPSNEMDISPSNLRVTKGQISFDDLVQKHPKMLHLTNLSGSLHSGFKEGSGDFSIPCEGFLYQDGKKLYAVDQLVVSGNILNLLTKIEALGDEYSVGEPSLKIPAVLVSALSVAGSHK